MRLGRRMHAEPDETGAHGAPEPHGESLPETGSAPAPVEDFDAVSSAEPDGPAAVSAAPEEAEHESEHIAEALRASADLRSARDRERAQQFVLEERLQVLLASEQAAREEHREQRARWSAEMATTQHELATA